MQMLYTLSKPLMIFPKPQPFTSPLQSRNVPYSTPYRTGFPFIAVSLRPLYPFQGTPRERNKGKDPPP